MQLSLSATSMMATILIVSMFVVAILPIQQASAKQCSDNDKDDTHGASCRHDQQNSDNHDDGSSKTTKDKTPFRLSLPFP